ncbi:MAG TPA: pyruvate kinase [Candidatus Tectomicrobia bacterium]|nr:pyruvate kinase [Candidatus Tectomicrobia bacterium]
MRQRQLFARRTKIVCTIGPASSSASLIERLIRVGMNVARLNLSHGTRRDHAHIVARVRRVGRRLGVPVAVLMDLPGPKYRTGPLQGGSVILKKGARLVLTTRPVEGDAQQVPVNLPSLPRDVRVGDSVLLDDGAMQLKVERTSGTDVVCRVIVGGTLTPGRGIVVPGMRISGPFLTPQLRDHLEFAISQQPDYLALSFVSCAQDVEQVRALLQQRSADLPIISKIERGQAISHLEEILQASDGIMVARGDLGVDIPLERLPIVQKDIIRRCNLLDKPVITATQMLESMVTAARPTRAEVTDVANAIFDGTDAVMLSAETSIGKHPVQAVAMMAKIATTTDGELPHERMLQERGMALKPQIDAAISYDACRTAHQLGAKVIIACTQSGSTARRVSKCHPMVPILALTPSEQVSRRLQLCWGVQLCQVAEPSSVEALFAMGANLPKSLGLAKAGDLVVITAGIPLGVTGTTNLLKVERIA